MKLIPVYYDIYSTRDGTTICVTDAAYFDAYGAMDDGSGPNYQAIEDAMEKCGYPALCESIHEFGGDHSPEEIPSLIEAMEAEGFELKTNPDFTRLVREPSTGG